MDDALITSAANPLVKRVRALTDRRTRDAERATVVEGLQPILQAHEAGWRFDTLVTSEDLRAEAGQRLVREQDAAGTRVARVSSELMARLSGRDRPSGLIAVVPTPDLSPTDLSNVRGPATWLALERLANPGNLGTILRTADATGCSGVLLVGPTADPFDPACLKASMGAAFHVPLGRVDDVAGLRAWAAARGAGLVTTAGRAAQDLWHTTFPERVVVLLGAEGPGLDDATLGAGDLQVAIPMTGHAESLNVGVAASVLLYEIWRQRSSTLG